MSARRGASTGAISSRVDHVNLSDGVIGIRSPRAGDEDILIAGRDDEFYRWIGPGAEHPAPIACIVVDDQVVGWVDYDVDHEWLEEGEVNVGYYVFPEHRRHGYALRAVELLMGVLADDPRYWTATLTIDPENERSLAVASRSHFTPQADVNGQRYFKRSVRSGGSLLR